MLLTLALLSTLQAQPAGDSIPGTWQINGDVAGNPLNMVCTIQQTDAVLTGSCAGPGGPAVAITGEVKDGKITFQHGGEYDGEPLTIIYTGTMETPGEMKGTVLVQPFDVSGYFTARPAEAPAPQQ